jgi:protein-tyrosine-phosphatase
MPGKIEKIKLININFVCTGNTCRSYMAEAIATHLLKTIYFKKKPGLKDKISIGSAGTDVLFSEIPLNTYRVLDMLEIPNIKFKPTQIDPSIIKNSDLIITMATSHKKNIIGNFSSYDEKKIINLIELSNIVLYLQSEKIYSRGAIDNQNIEKLKTGAALKKILKKLEAVKNVKFDSIIKTTESDISDPFGKSADDYLHVAKLIKENIIITFDYLFS